MRVALRLIRFIFHPIPRSTSRLPGCSIYTRTLEDFFVRSLGELRGNFLSLRTVEFYSTSETCFVHFCRSEMSKFEGAKWSDDADLYHWFACKYSRLPIRRIILWLWSNVHRGLTMCRLVPLTFYWFMYKHGHLSICKIFFSFCLSMNRFKLINDSWNNSGVILLARVWLYADLYYWLLCCSTDEIIDLYVTGVIRRVLNEITDFNSIL